MTSRAIVIVGGGFAGTTLARALDGKLPRDRELLFLSEESNTTFNPMLPEAVGASIFPEQVVAPIRQMLTRGRFVMGRVTRVDTAKQHTRLLVARRRASRSRYEHLVLAFGNRARLDFIHGLAEHALPLKTDRRRHAHPQRRAAPYRAHRAGERRRRCAAGSVTSW